MVHAVHPFIVKTVKTFVVRSALLLFFAKERDVIE